VTRLRVASFNVRNGRALDGRNSWPCRRRAAAAAVAGLDADVVGLQEVFAFQQRSLLRRLDGYVAVGRGRDDGRRGERTPLLLREATVRAVAHATRWYGDDPDRPGTRLPGARFPRIATLATVEVRATGALAQVVCTHLDASRRDARRAAAEQLAGWLDPSLPRVVVGDLNARPDAPELAPLLAVGLRHALPPAAGGTNHDFTGRTDGQRIDHILVSEEVEVLAAEVAHPRPGGRLPSDHWPVVADLVLPDPSGDPG
jgi:endonuclease/exonuclease/phosphatase family metal-dependent hydrolase